MIVFNTTMKVDHDVHDEWLRWMKREFIPAFMSTGKFMDHRMCRLLGVDEEEGITYTIQYTMPDMTAFHRFQEEDAYRLQKQQHERYSNKLVAFSTIMEKV